jgi:hypothetical protein
MAVGFKGIRASGYFYKAIAPKSNREAWRVKTFTRPLGAAVMAAVLLRADADPKAVLVYEDEDVPFMAKGRKFTPRAKRLLARLVSDEEASLLQAYGIDLAKLASKEK